MIQVNTTAPDFSLEGTSGTFKLSKHRGKIVVLLFYPGDNTTVCTRQFCSYRDEGLQTDIADAIVVGISGQDLESHSRFQQQHGLTIPLLADTQNEVARLYDLWLPVLGTRRATIIIDEDGLIRFCHVHRIGLRYLSSREIQAEIAKMKEK